MAVGWQRHAFARRLLLCYIVSVLYPVSYQTLVALLHCLCFIPSFLPDACCSVTLSPFYTQFPTRHLLLCYIVSRFIPSFLPDTCCSVTLSWFYTQFPTRHLLLFYIVLVLHPVSYQTLVALLLSSFYTQFPACCSCRCFIQHAAGIELCLWKGAYWCCDHLILTCNGC
jgi:hypothetical protein